MLDFWSLGVIGYEFLTGIPPFNDTSPEQVLHNVVNKEIIWPETGSIVGEQMEADAKDFLQKLLVREPEKRLGSMRGVKELKEHPFFKDINWETLATSPSPWGHLGKGKDLDCLNFPMASSVAEDL